jgi:hypothetical protein
MPIIKPIVRNPDGNIFYILGACREALRNRPNSFEAFKNETSAAMKDGKTDYNGMLAICMKYVDFQIDDQEDGEDE